MGRRNGYEYNSSTFSCPVRPPLTPNFPYLFCKHESFHLVFCLPLVPVHKSKGEGSFYITQYPVMIAAHPSFRPVHSDTNSASPRSNLAMHQLRATTKSLTFPPLSIARHSFIQLSQLGRQWRERKCPIFETVTKGIRTRVHLIASPTFYR